jgi:hypothetical protein
MDAARVTVGEAAAMMRKNTRIASVPVDLRFTAADVIIMNLLLTADTCTDRPIRLHGPYLN